MADSPDDHHVYIVNEHGDVYDAFTGQRVEKASSGGDPNPPPNPPYNLKYTRSGMTVSSEPDCGRLTGCLLVFLVIVGISGYIIWLGNQVKPRPGGQTTLNTTNFLLAVQYRGEGDSEKARVFLNLAVDDLNSAIKAHPQSGEAYEYRGLAYQFLGNYPQAIADGTQGVELQPKSSRAYNNRGTSYQASGDLEHALADYTKAIELNALCGKAFFNRGMVRLSRGEYELAAADFSSAVDHSLPAPKTPQMNPTKSKVFSDTMQFFLLMTEEADLPESYAYRGIAYAGLGKETEALADLNQAIDLRDDLSAAFFQRGLIYSQRGELEQAAADFNRVVELNNNPAVQQAAAEMLSSLRSGVLFSTTPEPFLSTEPPAPAESMETAPPPMDDLVTETPFQLPAQEPGAARVYFVIGSTLYRMNLDGSYPEAAAEGIFSTTGMFIDSPRHLLYLPTGEFGQRISGYDLFHPGGEVTIVNVPDYVGQGLAVDPQANKMFLALFLGGGVYTADLNEQPVNHLEQIVGGNQLSMSLLPGQLQLDPGKQQVYISTANGASSAEDQGIYRFNYDGSGLAKILPASRSDGLALDLAAGKIYYADGSDGWTIRRASLDGSGSEVVLTLPAPFRFCKSIALDGSHQDMYLLLYDPDSGGTSYAVARAKMDGSGYQILYQVKVISSFAGYGSLALYLP